MGGRIQSINNLLSDCPTIEFEKVKAEEFRFLLDELLESEIAPHEWLRVYHDLISEIRSLKDRWTVLRCIYKSLRKAYPHPVAFNITWKIARRFSILFTKGKFVDFYVPTEYGIQLFEVLTNPLDNESVRVSGQLTLLSFLSSKEVRA